MLKIKRDDEIIVIAGKDKGKRGSVQQVLDNGRLIVCLLYTSPSPRDRG